ncbi:MAG: 16S rRNA (guanine(966)-N(2))-methyltransferase RsmD [Microbacter sp.]
MRIISGFYKGRRFNPPLNMTARPTTDFAKEALFNVLTHWIDDWEHISVLDLFAGTGSISYEFISRGVQQVIAVEMSEKQLAFIHQIINKLQLQKYLKLHRMDVFRFLKKANSESFDIIFADPPYMMAEIDTLPDLIFEHSLLAPNGLFILEHSSKHDFGNHPYFKESRTYGNVHFSFFQKENEPSI